MRKGEFKIARFKSSLIQYPDEAPKPKVFNHDRVPTPKRDEDIRFSLAELLRMINRDGMSASDVAKKHRCSLKAVSESIQSHRHLYDWKNRKVYPAEYGVTEQRSPS